MKLHALNVKCLLYLLVKKVMQDKNLNASQLVEWSADHCQQA
jgi:hypothetical protein